MRHPKGQLPRKPFLALEGIISLAVKEKASTNAELWEWLETHHEDHGASLSYVRRLTARFTGEGLTERLDIEVLNQTPFRGTRSIHTFFPTEKGIDVFERNLWDRHAEICRLVGLNALNDTYFDDKEESILAVRFILKAASMAEEIHLSPPAV